MLIEPKMTQISILKSVKRGYKELIRTNQSKDIVTYGVGKNMHEDSISCRLTQNTLRKRILIQKIGTDYDQQKVQHNRHKSQITSSKRLAQKHMMKVQKVCFNQAISQNYYNYGTSRKINFRFYNEKPQHRAIKAFQKISFLNKENNQNKRSNSIRTSMVRNSKMKTFHKQHQFVSKKKLTMRTLQQNLQQTNIDLQSWELDLRRICKLVKELINFGILQKKINTWCKIYFETKKRGLIEVFMKKAIKRRSLNDEVTFSVYHNEETLISKVVETIQHMCEKQRYFLGIEITMYRNFLQQKIATKHKLQLNQIEDRVKSNVSQAPTKQLARDLYQIQKPNTEVFTFFNDLQRLQETYGQLALVSLKNRRRFENINKSQINIKKIIYD